eukprot:2666096-Rhodomonas_salina.2
MLFRLLSVLDTLCAVFLQSVVQIIALRAMPFGSAQAGRSPVLAQNNVVDTDRPCLSSLGIPLAAT